MKIAELKGRIPNEVLESFSIRGIKELNEPQERAVEQGLLDGKNIVVAAPTASGKTLIAELAIIKSILSSRRKAVYIAPMRALVNEKYSEFKEAYPYLKIALSIGELDSLDMWLADYDIIFVSTEKMESLIRHGINWLDSIGCIIIDEVHMLDDSTRGPTLEILMTKLKRQCRNAQFIALSATIGNADNIAEWLSAELVTSDYRPIKLKKGIVLQDFIYYKEDKEKLAGKSNIAETRISEDVLENGKQLIIFYSAKRNTEAGAERIKAAVAGYLTEHDKKELGIISEKIRNALSKPTPQCEKLAKDVENGVAFHHSGLMNVQRALVENAFRQNLIKVICSTTTLGIGVNMPAQTVLVKDVTRYSNGFGSEHIPVNEVLQLFGRAGRPKYDSSGRALLLAKDKESIIELYNNYISAKPEPIYSKIGVLPVLRSHLLSFIATEFLTSKESITNFMGETFYGYQYSDMRDIGHTIERIIKELEGWNFITEGRLGYEATKIGKRISELYIDPLTARLMMECLVQDRDEIANLFMITNTLEMRPYVKVTDEAEEGYGVYSYLIDPGTERNLSDTAIGYYDPLKPFSTALMLHDWINENDEPSIIKKYSTTPGALYYKVLNADWIIYAATELAKLMRISSTPLIEMRVRLRYGIKKELLDLVRLKNVGRVRARMLYNKGIKKVSDLRTIQGRKTAEELFGKEITELITGQLDGK
jgi:helicase